jgi:hypothetical protein
VRSAKVSTPQGQKRNPDNLALPEIHTYRMDLLKITDFLMVRTREQTPAKEDLKVLHGWKPSMLVSYNAGVKKYKKLKHSIGHLNYPSPCKGQGHLRICNVGG